MPGNWLENGVRIVTPQGVRNGDTQRLCEALATGPKSIDDLAAAAGIARKLVNRRLRQRAALRGDVEFVDGLWRICPRLVVSKTKAARKPRQGKQAQVKQGAAAVEARAKADVVCEVATSRTYSAPGVWVPPRMVIRDGAFDYLATPTRVGDERLPYRGATNMSTTAMAAGARSGVK